MGSCWKNPFSGSEARCFVARSTVKNSPSLPGNRLLLLLLFCEAPESSHVLLICVCSLLHQKQQQHGLRVGTGSSSLKLLSLISCWKVSSKYVSVIPWYLIEVLKCWAATSILNISSTTLVKVKHWEILHKDSMETRHWEACWCPEPRCLWSHITHCLSTKGFLLPLGISKGFSWSGFTQSWKSKAKTLTETYFHNQIEKTFLRLVPRSYLVLSASRFLFPFLK